MLKKLFMLLLCLVMVVSFVGCGNNDNPVIEETPDDESSAITPDDNSTVSTPAYYVNGLTGIKNLTEDKKDLRPVAVMVNNIKVAQKVQSGVQNADIIYETEVEGGITRLLAVFKDITAAKQIGTIRSARYVYIDLALGHDAFYFHNGTDVNYAKPHLKSSGVTDCDFASNFGAYGFRENNGLALEHTYYSTSEKINKGIEDKKLRKTTDKNFTFASFREEGERVAPVKAATFGSVRFSSSYVSEFTYNTEKGVYTKNTKGVTNKDYKTGETYDVTNVFFLASDMSHYPKAEYRKIDLTSGKGYYMSAGGYEEITWEKGGSNDSFKFYAADGSELKVNAGKSWVCIYSKKYTPTFQ